MAEDELLTEVAGTIMRALLQKYPLATISTQPWRVGSGVARLLFYPTGTGSPVEITMLPPFPDDTARPRRRD